MIGQLLAGHYKVLEVLGEGGFGQTYIVEDIHLPGHPQCVLKHLKPTSAEPQVLEIARKLFQREAEILQQLGNYDQIPRLLAYFEENREFYLVQELIKGHTLSQELTHGQQWKEAKIAEVLIEILGILEIVHNHGVIHRDIKPDNIIRCELDQKLVLIDFGAIKQLRNQTAISHGQKRVTITVGTPGYMPSEQTRKLPRPSSDIYALGMIGIQALTGVCPRELPDDTNTGEIVWKHLTPVTPGLAAVLTKMTHYHFKDRYQTATEALAALKNLSNLVEVPAVTPVAVPQMIHELTLEWREGGEIKDFTLIESQDSKTPARIRIGRDPQVCNIVVPEASVSALHAEIFFYREKNQFYLRNLRQKNPPILDGQLLLAGEMPLAIGSSLRLGQQQFKVSIIQSKRSSLGYIPQEEITDLSTVLPSEPISKTAPPQKVIYSQQVKRAGVSVIAPLVTKKPVMMGIGIAAVVSMMGALVCSQTGNSAGKAYSEQNFIAQQPQLCRVISPTGGNFLAKLRPEPQTEIGALKQLNQGEKVLFVKVKGDFVKVRLVDGTQGWVFGDQIQRCDSSRKELF
jgi:eukaryotic-like serine/threonine-protein kinase